MWNVVVAQSGWLDGPRLELEEVWALIDPGRLLGAAGSNG
jgi:hypothetical protein